MTELTQFEIFNGIGMVIILILLWYIGLRLVLKYFSLKDKNLLILALVFIFQGYNWLGPVLLFLYLYLTGTLISLELLLLTGFAFSFSPFFWITLLTELMFKKNRKLIISLVGIYFAVSTIIFFYLFFTNISLIGTSSGLLTFQQGPFLLFRNLVIMILSLIFTILFYRESHKSDNPEIRLRGTLFLIAFILLILGGISHMLTGLVFIVLIFVIVASICYYTALLTPEWMRKRLIKETE